MLVALQLLGLVLVVVGATWVFGWGVGILVAGLLLVLVPQWADR